MMNMISPAFDPVSSLAGGALIGASASILLATHGKIAGISGITRKALFDSTTRPSDRAWRIAFVSGLLSSGAGLALVAPAVFGPAVLPAPLLTAAVSGGLVGLGTSLGSGCTSGHGVCGLPRFSVRSLVAVLTFMGSAAATLATLYSTGILAPHPLASPLARSPLPLASNPLAGLAAAAGLASLWVPRDASSALHKILAWGLGALFGVGLGVGGMLNPLKVMGFLSPHAVAGGWDPSLAGVMGGAVAVTTLAFAFLRSSGKTLLDGVAIDWPTNTKITRDLILGSAMFGVGWGLVGLCPGPAVTSLAAGLSSPLAAWAAAYAAGQYIFANFW